MMVSYARLVQLLDSAPGRDLTDLPASDTLTILFGGGDRVGESESIECSDRRSLILDRDDTGRVTPLEFF